MNCPVCVSFLAPMDRQGVEIDYCPKCRGVWLDRGELDKIIALASRYRPGDDDDDDDDDDRRRQYTPHPSGYQPPGHPPHSQYPPHKKKEGFWSRMFDFD